MASDANAAPILSVRDLKTYFFPDEGTVPGKTAMDLPASIDITGKNFYDELMKYISKA